jgi:hypothetical protein
MRRAFVFGLLGPPVLLAGCASGLTSGSNSSDAPAASATQLTEQTKADKAAQTKQVTLSVSGMT